MIGCFKLVSKESLRLRIRTLLGNLLMINVDLSEQFIALGRAASESPIDNPLHYVQLAANLFYETFTPAKIVQIVGALERDGYVVILTDLRNYAAPTPTTLTEKYPGPYFGELAIALIGKIFGNLQSLPHQHNGRLFHDVMPIKVFQKKQTSGSSGVLLEMHTELSFVDVPPEYLLLLCVREDLAQKAETHLFDSRKAIGKLDQDTYKCLSSKNYTFKTDDNATSDQGVSSEPVAIIDGATAKLLRFDVNTCRPLDEKAQCAVKKLESLLMLEKISLRLKTGQILIADNNRVVHSRGAFSASYDGRDRWLKRALIRRH